MSHPFGKGHKFFRKIFQIMDCFPLMGVGLGGDCSPTDRGRSFLFGLGVTVTKT